MSLLASWIVRDMRSEDITHEHDFSFIRTLEALAPIGDVSIGWMRTAFARRKKLGMHQFVAVTPQGKVIGTATLLVELKFLHGCSTVGHIEDVAVHPGHQGEGIGKALVQACIARAKQVRSCYKVILNCKDGLVPYYEKFGFKHHESQMRLDLQA